MVSPPLKMSSPLQDQGMYCTELYIIKLLIFKDYFHIYCFFQHQLQKSITIFFKSYINWEKSI